MKAHAKLSASGSHRWLACPGSIKAEEGRPDKKSFFADEGSAAHELMEICLTENRSPFDLVGKTLMEYNEFVVTQEMAEGVQYYVDYIKLFGNYRTSTMEVETVLQFHDWVPDGYGTADTIIFNGDSVDIFDLKFGKGIVSAQENTQGLLYMLGAMDHMFHESQTFRFHIVQPRLDHIDTWQIDREELLKRGEWIKERAALALTDDAPRTPGEKQCQYCKAKADCLALAKLTTDVLMTDFDTMQTVNPDRLDAETLRKAMEAKKLIVSWLDAVEEHITTTINETGRFPGYKLVEGRSLRQWSSDAEAEKRLTQLLGEDAYERKVLSVAKAEKTLGKKRVAEIADLIEKPQGKATLAPESDPRPSIFDVSAEFDSFA
jgi:hypothetical protein